MIIKEDKQEWFLNRVKEVHKNKFKILSQYVNTKTYVDIQCNDCGELIKIRPYNLLQGSSCKKCNNRKRITEGDVIDILSRENYSKIDGTITNIHSKIDIKHNVCGNTYKVSINNFKNNNRRCPYCEGSMKKDIDFIRKFMKDKLGNEYTLISDNYVNKDSKLKFIHNECGKECEFTYNNIRNDKFSCPFCMKSRGEEIVSGILEGFGIEYSFQKKFSDCKNEKELPFDFYIELDDKRYIIEYDGRQHYLPIYGKTIAEKMKSLERTKLHDSIKNQYCIDNNIRLLRIKYDTEVSEVPDIIHDFLNNN